MRKTASKHVLAAFVSDLHLSHVPPRARAMEDWYEVMHRYLMQLNDLLDLGVPLVCAGDLFDSWKQPPELLNFLLDSLPEMIAIPGQHDLPHHRYEDWHKSAFGTMVKARRVHMLLPGMPTTIFDRRLVLHGFPWGTPITPLKKDPRDKHLWHVAVCHSYIWTQGRSYPGAPKSKSVHSYRRKLKGYHAAFFGDNHKGFVTEVISPSRCVIVNCGGFFRRKTDEVRHVPKVSMLMEDGTVKRIPLDTSADIISEPVSTTKAAVDLDSFLKELRGLAVDTLDFREAIINALDNSALDDRARRVVLELLEGA